MGTSFIYVFKLFSAGYENVNAQNDSKRNDDCHSQHQSVIQMGCVL